MTDHTSALLNTSAKGEHGGSVSATAPPNSTPVQPVLRSAKGRFVSGSGKPPQRRGGGQIGNMNHTPNPWVTYWRRRALKPVDRWALALVRDYVPSLVADKGGEDNVSFAQMKVMELAAVARVCWALAMAAGNLDVVARFIAAERQALADLGLARKAREVQSLAEYMAARQQPQDTPAAEEPAEGTPAQQDVAQAEPEQGQP